MARKVNWWRIQKSGDNGLETIILGQILVVFVIYQSHITSFVNKLEVLDQKS